MAVLPWNLVATDSVEHPSYGTAVPETGDVHLITLTRATNGSNSRSGPTRGASASYRQFNTVPRAVHHPGTRQEPRRIQVRGTGQNLPALVSWLPVGILWKGPP
jgi:hypothetical protein